MDLVASRGHGTGVIWFEGPDWQVHDIDAVIRSHTVSLPLIWTVMEM
jgi:hypothetical protein